MKESDYDMKRDSNFGKYGDQIKGAGGRGYQHEDKIISPKDPEIKGAGGRGYQFEDKVISPKDSEIRGAGGKGYAKEVLAEVEVKTPDGQTVRGRPDDLLAQGLLTPETILPGQEKEVMEDIMYGSTRTPKLLEQKIALIGDPKLVAKLVNNQFMAVHAENKSEENGYRSTTGSINRKFQLMATLNILMKNGYDMSQIRIGSEEKNTDIVMALAALKRDCDRPNVNKSMNDPVTGEITDKNPSTFVGQLARQLYDRNKGKYMEAYKKFLSETRLPEEDRDTCGNYLRRMFGVNISDRDADMDMKAYEEKEQSGKTTKTMEDEGPEL